MYVLDMIILVSIIDGILVIWRFHMSKIKITIYGATLSPKILRSLSIKMLSPVVANLKLHFPSFYCQFMQICKLSPTRVHEPERFSVYLFVVVVL